MTLLEKEIYMKPHLNKSNKDLFLHLHYFNPYVVFLEHSSN